LCGLAEGEHLFDAGLAGLVAVAATTSTGERTSGNYAFVDAVARKNVEMTMANIRKDSPVLAEMESNGAVNTASIPG
jgi:carbonic anhydrase